MKPVDLPIIADEACAIIQKYFRGWIIRKLISLLYCSKIITRVWDNDDHCAYYYNKITGKSMWKLPSFIYRFHIPYIADHSRDDNNNFSEKK
jgi:hypothetical protein